MLWQFDQTLNMLSMFSFVIALGIVVDDAIVIGENIYAHREMGKNFTQASIDGTMEVLPSVAASVTTTVFAFTPMFFVTGVMGKFFAVMPLAVIAMLLISVVESALCDPSEVVERADHRVCIVCCLVGFELGFEVPSSGFDVAEFAAEVAGGHQEPSSYPDRKSVV